MDNTLFWTTAQNHSETPLKSSLTGSHSKASNQEIGLPSVGPTKAQDYKDGPGPRDSDLEQCAAADSTRKGSNDSMESMQQHITLAEPLISDPDSLTFSESEPSGDEDELKAELITSSSTRLALGSRRLTLLKGSKEKKKVGRPIAYKGDPDSPALTEQERRRIKRRIANRESARRVRHKRQELLDDLQIKIDVLQSQNANLRSYVAESKQEKENLSRQLRDLTGKHKQLMSTNANMHVELESLRSCLQLRMTALENALDRQENGTDSQDVKTLFGSFQAQSSTSPGYCSQPEFPFVTQGEFKGSASFQMAIENFPSFQLEERSVELLPTEPHS